MKAESSRLLRLRPIRLSAAYLALVVLLSGCQSMDTESLERAGVTVSTSEVTGRPSASHAFRPPSRIATRS